MRELFPLRKASVSAESLLLSSQVCSQDCSSSDSVGIMSVLGDQQALESQSSRALGQPLSCPLAP